MPPQLLLIGLGNPGKSYENTRHNIGWLALDRMAKAIGAGEWEDKQKFASSVAQGMLADRPCLLVKPQTFMNRSGEAVQKITQFYKLDAAKQILVVCDDIDIALGTYRLRMSGGPGTHNGLKSIVDSLGEAFPRLRIGIGKQPEGWDLAAWVLSKMTPEESAALEPTLAQLPEVVLAAVNEMAGG